MNLLEPELQQKLDDQLGKFLRAVRNAPESVETRGLGEKIISDFENKLFPGIRELWESERRVSTLLFLDGNREPREEIQVEALHKAFSALAPFLFDSFTDNEDADLLSKSIKTYFGLRGLQVGDGSNGFLGLIVDANRGEVRRVGFMPTAFFIPDSAEFYTFLCAWNARPDGATQHQWINGYPGNPAAGAMRSVKRNVNEKLMVLDIRLASRVPPRLEKIVNVP